MKRTSGVSIFLILAVGTLFGWMILFPEQIPFRGFFSSTKTENLNSDTLEEGSDEPRGPHGGRLLQKDNLRLEVKIYESGVPPEFRIYPTTSNEKAIPLQEIQLEIILERLDQTDRIQFRPVGDYLQGDQEVVEPHSFDVTVKAAWKGMEYQWNFPSHEARTRISPEAAKNAGITTSKAGPAVLKKVETLNGEIGLHEKRVTHVVPRVDAMVVRVVKDLGDPVKKGDLLAVLESRELADAKSIYLAALKRAEPARIDLERQTLIYKNTKTMLELLSQEIDLTALRAEIDSLVLGEVRADLVPAYAFFLRTRSVYLREKSLFEKKISSRSEYLQALEEHKSADARFHTLKEQSAYLGQLTLIEKRREHEMAQLNIQTSMQKLMALGLSKKEIDRLTLTDQQKFTQYELQSTINGEVIQKHISVGESVKRDADIFVLADLSEVWVNIAVPARYLNRVKIGQSIRVRSATLGMEAVGKLTYLGSIIEEKTRTVTGRLVISNRKRLWRPGMYVTIELELESHKVPLAVPKDAIQTIRDWSVVFIKVNDTYEARPLELGKSDGKWVEVLSGLKPNAEYVTGNSFAVKAEIGKSGATHSH